MGAMNNTPLTPEENAAAMAAAAGGAGGLEKRFNASFRPQRTPGTVQIEDTNTTEFYTSRLARRNGLDMSGYERQAETPTDIAVRDLETGRIRRSRGGSQRSALYDPTTSMLGGL